jgi:hypothetical protein
MVSPAANLAQAKGKQAVTGLHREWGDQVAPRDLPYIRTNVYSGRSTASIT